MKLVIKNIVLYPFDTELTPRKITFQPDKVNVITGYSQRGKSALIPIIDYCLGSSDCNIPIGKIRETTDKFAINIELNDLNIFIARDNPDGSKRTNMYYDIYEEEKDMAFSFKKWIDNADDYKVNRDTLKNFIGEKAGFENISENDEESTSGFDAPASFRDTTAFQFQSQNIVANPTTMFYNTDSFEHLARLRTLFPLVLGYKSYEILNLEKEIEILVKEEKEKSKKYEDIKKQYENWQGDIYEYYTKAINLGLTNSDIDIDSSKVNLIRNELSRVVRSIKNRSYFQEGSAIRYSEKFEELDNQRMDLVQQLVSFRSDLSKIELFDSSKENYLAGVTAEIDNRLKPIDWFLNQEGTNFCPFCDSKSEKAVEALIKLKQEKNKNDVAISESKKLDFSFEKEKNKIKKHIRELEVKIKKIDSNMTILSNESQEEYQNYKGIFEFAGKIEHVLENLEKISPTGELAMELDKLDSQILKKKKKLRTLKEKFDRELCLSKVTKTIGEYIKLLPIEEKESRRVHLDPERSANIRIENTKTNQLTFLSKLGSGANHMCYHVATLLGLHEYFYKLPESGKKNYISSFLIFDQPSQVYFPESFPDAQEIKSNENKKVSEDVFNTTLIFKTCSEFMRRTNFNTQLIILEHAPINTWKDIEHIHLVEEWRGDINVKESEFNALIPRNWLVND